MVKVKVISDKPNKRILRCSEDNRVWYRLWITDLDMNCIEKYFKGYDEVNYLIFKCGMFSFIERMVVRLGEY